MRLRAIYFAMLHKIREALRQRDDSYKLKSQLELDGATFGRRESGTEQEVLIAVETKEWINASGKRKARAGFAKVIGAKKEIVNAWLPGVHKLSSNSKAWVIGTHHGGNSDYLESYLAEYFYRFNRRHDPKRLFHRAVRACVLAQPRTNGTLFG